MNQFDNSNSWVLLSPIEKSIKEKIEKAGTPLKDWNIQIYRGILTGFNEAFIISTETRNMILNNCKDDAEKKRTDEIIRPILRGRDIKRFGYNWANLWLINTHNGIKGKTERVHIEDYPAIKVHLDKYWNRIENRADQGDTPYNLRNCAYMDDFSKPIIAWQRITHKNQFCLTEPGTMVLDSMAFLSNVGEKAYLLLAILNSDLVYYWMKSNVHEYGDTGFRFSNQYVQMIPVPQTVDKDNETELIKLTVKMLNDPDQATEEKINQIVYNIYNLTNAETEYLLEKL